MVQDIHPRKALALALVLALFAFFLYAMLPYVKAVFGAIIFYVLFQPLYDWFVEKGVSKGLSGVLVIITSILVILIPLFLVLSLVAGEVGTVVTAAHGIADNLDQLDEAIATINIREMAEDILSSMGAFLKSLVATGFTRAASLMVSLTIMFFLFYFLMVNHNSITKGVRSVIPFNKKNTTKLLTQGKNITYSVVLSTGLMAVVQGLLVSIGFHFAGLPAAVLWGIVAGILSFLPVIGTPVIWGPAGILLLFKGEYVAGIGLLVWGGVVIMNIDNVLRPIIQKRVADIHPLISILGVFIGIPYFGLLGLIAGPLLLSYLILTVQMFREEYT